MDNQTLEIQMKAQAQNAIQSLNLMTKKLFDIENAVNNVSNSVNRIRDLSGFVKEIDKATMSAKRLEKINLSSFESKLKNLYDSLSKFSSSFKVDNIDSLEKVSKTLGRIPTSISKINSLDMKKTYGSFNALTRIIDPFLTKLRQSEVSLSNFVQISKSLETSAKSVKVIEKNIDSVKQKTDKATTSANHLSKALNFGGAFLATKRLTSQFLGWIDNAKDYTEQLNLFNVVFKNVEKDGVKTFSTLGREATKFQYKLNEAFGTNKTETLYAHGIFQSMGNNVGIPEEYSAIMSETMTKFTYDLASLYNKSEKNVAEALRAGVYAGQTKPLRSYGIDVTQQSMEPILDELGISRSVKQLSQAEKEILRYIAALRQGSVAMGDFANTIESPANQLKIFKQQLVEAKVAFTSLFIGSFAEILPYANAILMVIKEISKAIATMFGIELKDYNTSIASSENAFDSLDDSIGNATKSAKKLKREVLGFDEIHNIDEKKDSGSSSSSVSGGIDKRLLDAIDDYDNGMDKVRMKANDIRDAIMKWLGFTKEIDPLTGEVSFKYRGIKETLSNIWQSFKKLNPLAKLFVAIGVGNALYMVAKKGKLALLTLGNTGLLKTYKNLLSPTKTLSSLLKDDLAGGISGLSGSVKESIDLWSKSLTTTEKIKTTIAGAGGLIVGFALAREAAYNLNETGKMNTKTWAELAGSLASSATSGALIGATFGGAWGAVFGGAAGVVADLLGFLTGIKTEQDKIVDGIIETSDEIQEYCQSIKDYYDSVDKSADNQLKIHEQNEIYVEELENLIDSNGKVKDSYKDRVNFILNELNGAYGTEYKLVDDQIYQNGKLIGSNDEIIESINKVIQAKKNEIILEANKAKYAKAVEEQATSLKNYEEAVENLKKAEEAYDDLLKQNYYDGSSAKYWQKQYESFDEFKEAMEKSHDALGEGAKTALDKARNAVNLAKDDWANCTEIITNYEEMMAASISGNMDRMEEAVRKFSSGANTSLSEQIHFYKSYGDQVAENTGKINDSTYSMLDATINTLKKQSQSIENLTPDIIEAWGTLAKDSKDKFFNNFKDLLPNVQKRIIEEQPSIVKAFQDLASESEDKFLEQLEKLNPDIQENIIKKMQDKGYDISNELQKGINKLNPTIKVKANVSSAKKTVSSLVGDISSNLLNLGLNLTKKVNGGIYSNGSWKNIAQYANGGAPSHGSMFVAGEHGAEIVGHINGRTEVLNQSQIASAIYSAVYSAMSQFSGQQPQIDLHVHTDEGTVIDRVNQKTKQTGVCPIYIPA